jgi:hypothetical protein
MGCREWMAWMWSAHETTPFIQSASVSTWAAQTCWWCVAMNGRTPFIATSKCREGLWLVTDEPVEFDI